MNPNLLTHAQMALERADYFEASQLFRLHVTHFPDISGGWLGLFQSSDQPAERLECLEQLLRITHAENQALGIETAPAVADDEALETTARKPEADVASAQPCAESTTAEDESDGDSDNPPYQFTEIVPTYAVPQAAPGWPTLKAKLLQHVALAIETGGELFNQVEIQLTPAALFLKRRIKSHSFFSSQFSTSYGRKLRRVPNQRLQRLTKVLS
jgi:hypothetical protein